MADGTWDVVVIGAGAAGLMAAIRAAESGRRTLLLEKNRKAGVKILMSGGTRCNITHATDNRGIVEAYGPPGKFLHSPLASLSVADTVAFFEREGVATKVEETGKIFPVSNKAADVLAALLRRLNRSGAELALAEPVTGFTRGEHGFAVTTPRRVVTAPAVILTTGGQSYPGSGTTGDGFRFACEFGHTIVPPRPALVPVTTAATWVTELRGVTIPDTGVKLVGGGKVLGQRRGSLLFAHFGLSGPVALDISREVSGHPDPKSLTLLLDFLPGAREDDVATALLEAAAQGGKKLLANVMFPDLPRRLCAAILGQAGLTADRPCTGLRKDERQQIVRRVKALEVPVSGTLGFEKAEVTAGGVSLKEVDSKTMRSKLVPGLYLAGEVLDLDGPIGGYNFQAAWSTGWLAGGSAGAQ